MSSMRRFIGVLGVVLAGRGALGCGQLLQDESPSSAGDDAGGTADATGESPDALVPPDASAPEVGPDVGIDGGCRASFVDGFEASDWNATYLEPPNWNDEGFLGTGKLERSAPGHTTAANALRFTVDDTVSYAFLSKTLSGSCAITIEVSVMRKSGSTNRLSILELVAGTRRRTLSLVGPILALEGYLPGPDNVMSDFGYDTYHRILLRYSLDGATYLAVDGEKRRELEPVGDGDFDPGSFRIGIFAPNGQGTGDQVFFDDISAH